MNETASARAKKYKKITLLLFCGICLLGLFVLLTNAVSPDPTFELVEDRVTRFYHDNPNPNDEGKPLANAAYLLLQGYATAFGGLGFSAYQLLNILIYALLCPLILVLSTYWAFAYLGPAPRPKGSLLSRLRHEFRLRRILRRRRKEGSL